jgi:hypothetical protein
VIRRPASGPSSASGIPNTNDRSVVMGLKNHVLLRVAEFERIDDPLVGVTKESLMETETDVADSRATLAN